MKETIPEKSTSYAISVFRAIAVLAIGCALVFFVYGNATKEGVRFPFKLGLDLAGGSHLVYEADVSKIAPAEVDNLMNVLRDVIENRINVFGVSEPIVQVEQGSFVNDSSAQRLVVELPGVTDVADAVAEIGKTPLLEFKLVDQDALAASETVKNLAVQGLNASGTSGAVVDNIKVNGSTSTEPYIDTGLTGRYLESASLEFANGQGSNLANEPLVSIVFNKEGAELFEKITRENVGQQLAIFLDGELLSAPNINEPIAGGSAVISGSFTAEEAKELAQNLNFGALPVPIELVSTQTIGASLGGMVVEKGVMAGLYGILLVMVFIILWYRLPGIIASIALVFYVAMMLSLFQLIPVTLTAAGLAGFILSIGMAVDANVLVFERMKEELRDGNNTREAAVVGFNRAWTAIRDGNVTSILSAIILFWFGTSIVKGFALVFGLGVVVSMFTALTITRTLLLALPTVEKGGRWLAIYKSGLSK